MENAVFNQIGQLLGKNTTVNIAVGNTAGLDEMAAALSLYLSLTQAGKTVSIASPKEPTVAISSLVGINKVKTDLGGGTDGDLIVAFPYKEGEIEKISYTLENGFLNIVVKAGELGLSFDQKDVQYKRSGGSATSLLFVIGAPTLSSLGRLFDAEGLKNTTIVNIDNKADNQGFGEVVMVSPKMSSVSEQIAELLITLNLPLDIDISQNLLSGIADATDNFKSPTSSALAFEMAGILMRKGAVRKSEQTAFNPMSLQQRPQQVRPQPRPQQQQPRPMQPVNNPFLTQSSVEDKENKKDETPPDDWLMPKVYKGSTNV